MWSAVAVLKVSVGELQIAYRESGSGPGVLFLNGTGESGATWEAQMRALEDRHRCVAIDQRDTGDSSYADSSYTPRDLADDAAGVIEALGLAPCHVVGFSLGGAAAQELALARPDLVRSIVLLSTWAKTDGWFAAQMRNWQAIRRAHADDEAAFLFALETWMFSPATFRDDALRGSIIAMWAAETIQRPDGWMRQTEADIAHDALDRLGSLELPALVIVGEDDICTPPRYARQLADAVKGSRLVTIEQAGHCAVFEQPSAVAVAIGDFLDGQG